MKTEKFIDRLNDLVDLAKLKAKVKGSIDMQGIVSELIGTAYQADPAMVDSVLLAMGKEPSARPHHLDMLNSALAGIAPLAAGTMVFITVKDGGFRYTQVTGDSLSTLLDETTDRLWGGGMDGADIESIYQKQVDEIRGKGRSLTETPAQADLGASRRQVDTMDVEEAVSELRVLADDIGDDMRHVAERVRDACDVIEGAYKGGTLSLSNWITTKADIARKNGMSDTANTLTAIVEGIRQHLVDEPADDPVEAMRRWIGAVAAQNKDAGWWTNLRTGEALDRNVGELLMLVVTELSEAFEGHRKSKPGAIIMDDHLPHRRAFEVEIGDVFIRLGDLSGNLVDADGNPYDVPGAIAEKREYNARRADHKVENRIKPGGKEL